MDNNKFTWLEKILNQELKETYLLGYYLQRAELNKGKKEQEEM